MFDTKTTPFSIMNTPYGKDITRMIAVECHRQGLALGQRRLNRDTDLAIPNSMNHRNREP